MDPPANAGDCGRLAANGGPSRSDWQQILATESVNAITAACNNAQLQALDYFQEMTECLAQHVSLSFFFRPGMVVARAQVEGCGRWCTALNQWLACKYHAKHATMLVTRMRDRNRGTCVAQQMEAGQLSSSPPGAALFIPPGSCGALWLQVGVELFNEADAEDLFQAHVRDITSRPWQPPPAEEIPPEMAAAMRLAIARLGFRGVRAAGCSASR
jgi:hypothetical protein